MPISRRIFLRAGSMLALGTAASSKFAKVAFGQKSHDSEAMVMGFRVPSASMNDPLTFFTKSTFVAQLNTKFRLRLGRSISAIVTLVAVNDLMPTKNKVTGPVVGNRECFSLIFSGKELPQGTYTVEHGALGRFQLLLVPSGIRGSIPQLEAVINRSFS